MNNINIVFQIIWNYDYLTLEYFQKKSEKSTVPINFLNRIYWEYSSYQRITEWLGLEGTLRGHLVSPLNDLSTQMSTWSVSLISQLTISTYGSLLLIKKYSYFLLIYLKMTFINLKMDHRDLNVTGFYKQQKK